MSQNDNTNQPPTGGPGGMDADKGQVISTQRGQDAPPGEELELEPKQGFTRAFWMLNTMEMWERLAYYGMRLVVPIYIAQADEIDGLQFTQAQKGSIFALWALVQSLLPMFTGGYADRYGYKLTIFVSVTIKIIGYVLMATQRTYFGFLMGALVLAAGTAIFKPGIQGSLAQQLNKHNSSVGWGFFYWVVNIGSFLGPPLAGYLRDKSWAWVFYGCAIIVSLNYFMLFTYKEVKSGSKHSRGFVEVFIVTMEDIWLFWFKGGSFNPVKVLVGLLVVALGFWITGSQPSWVPIPTTTGIIVVLLGMSVCFWLDGGTFTWQLRLPAFLAIMTGFWMMMYQVWDLGPNVIVDWVDSESLANKLPEWLQWMTHHTSRGLQVTQENVLNLNAGLIVLLVVEVTWLVRRMRRLTSIMIGIICATFGVVVVGMAPTVYLFAFGIALFSLGEMLSSPKKNEYLSLIAPPGKKAQYLGYVNIPVAVGQGIGAVIAGVLYGSIGEKAAVSLKELAAKPDLLAVAAQTRDWSATLDRIPDLIGIERDEAFERVVQSQGRDQEAVAEMLREIYRYDKGQITNLGLLYLAELPENAETLESNLPDALKDGFDPEENENWKPPADPVLAELLTRRRESLQARHDFGKKIEVGDIKASEIDLTPYVSLLDDVLNVSRSEYDIPLKKIFAKSESHEFWMQFSGRAGEGKSELEQQITTGKLYIDDMDTDTFKDEVVKIVEHEVDLFVESIDDRIREALWKKYGDRPGVLDNLALEYIAQGTDEIRQVASKLTFKDSGGNDLSYDEVIRPALDSLFGIDRTEAFLDVVRATGISDDGLNEIIAAETTSGKPIHERVLEYYRKNPEYLPAQILEDNDDAEEALEEDELTTKKLLVDLTDEELEVQIGWNRLEYVADLKGQLGIGPRELTSQLWRDYDPWRVWMPFAGIGILSLLALIVFNKKAEQWTDMNV